MKIACAVMAFDRSAYLGETLAYLRNNTLAKEVDWHFFVDNAITNKGRIVGDAEGVDTSKRIIKSIFPSDNYNAALHQNAYNLGIARQKQKVHRLFRDYDVVMFFEDDMIVSKHYLQLLLAMFEQFPNDVVNAPARKIQNTRSDSKLDEVFIAREHLWGYALNRHSFFKIKERYDEYCEDVGDDYQYRVHTELKVKYNLRISSHDCALDTFFAEQGIRRIVTRVPRGKYIGDKGVHYRPKTYKEGRFDEQNVFEFEEDANIKHFTLVTK